MNKTVSAVLVSAAASGPALATEWGNDGYLGGFALVGWASQHDVERAPAQPTPVHDSSDANGASFGLGAWLGYDWKRRGLPLRTELAATWRYRHDINLSFTEAGGTNPLIAKSDVMTLDIVTSALYDIPVSGKLKPYIGAGLGAVYSDVDSYLFQRIKFDGPGSSGWDFAWQLQGGVTYAISPAMDLRVDYRYVDLGTVESGPLASGDSFTADLVSHDLRIGASWKF